MWKPHNYAHKKGVSMLLKKYDTKQWETTNSESFRFLFLESSLYKMISCGIYTYLKSLRRIRNIDSVISNQYCLLKEFYSV